MEGPNKPVTVEIGVGERAIAEQEAHKRLRRDSKVHKEAVQWVVQAVEQLAEVQGSAAPEVAKWVRANVQQMPVGGGEGTVLLALKRAVRQGLLQRAPGGRFLLPSADAPGAGLAVAEAAGGKGGCGCPSKTRKRKSRRSGKRRKCGKSRRRGRSSRRRKKRRGGSKRCKSKRRGRGKRSRRRRSSRRRRCGKRSRRRSRSGRSRRRRSRSCSRRRKSRCPACVKLWKNHLREGNQMLCQHCRVQRQKRNKYDRTRRRKGGRKGSRRGSKGRGRRGRRCPDFADDIDSK